MRTHLNISLLLILISLPFIASAQRTDSITIELARNKSYKIALDYCPGAGSGWIISDTLDKSVISLISKNTKLKDGNGPLGGYYTDFLVFQAKALGSKTITLELRHLKELKETKVLMFKVT